MILRDFTFSLFATAECELCGTIRDIDDSEWHLIKASELNLELVDKFEEVATQQADADGWKDNYCPDCVEHRSGEIHALEMADEDWEDER